MLAVSLNDRLTIGAPGPLITATILVYSAILILLGRSAVANVRELESLGMTDTLSRAMMISSIVLARALNMGVVAEGVETEEQAELVRLAGCDQIQGWLYYRALPAIEIDRLLDEQNRNLSEEEAAA